MQKPSRPPKDAKPIDSDAGSTADPAATPTVDGQTSRPDKPSGTKCRMTFAAFLRSIPPGDAFDDADFARIQ
ncbi:hypothetical protein GCM10009080_38210 [Cupriavidus pauculus]|jgi:hypothetical protein